MAEWVSLAGAIAAHVRDGGLVFAAGHEIIRRRRRNLSLIRMTPDLIYDRMKARTAAAHGVEGKAA